MRGAWRLLGKDLRLLLRSRGLVVLLIGYPLVVATLVTVALQSGERRPDIAFVNEDTSNRTVRVGDQRLGIADYESRLAREVNLTRLDADAAAAALRDGRVSAVLTVPEGFIRDLQSGLRSPVIELDVGTRSPIEAESISRRLEAAVFRLNQDLAETYVRQTLELVDIIIKGGDIAAFTRQGNVLGLERSEELVRRVQERLRAVDQEAEADRLDPLLNFIVQAGVNLELANSAATAISRPITLRIAEPPAGRAPLSGFGLAGALVVSLGLLGVLLAAAALSAEREEGTLTRLRRGLVADPAIIGGKVAFAAIVTVLIGAVLLVVVELATSVTVGRWGWWAAALVAAGAAFGAVGALIGTVARETRGALLAALMIALPFVFLALFTQSDAATAVSQVTPFGPAFRTFQSLLVDSTVAAGDLGVGLAQLAVMTLVFGGVAAILLRRGAES